MKCSLEWQLYITARSDHESDHEGVEKMDTRPALPSDFFGFPMYAARANFTRRCAGARFTSESFLGPGMRSH